MSKIKKRKTKHLFSVFLTGSFFVLIHSLALLVIKPFEAAGMNVFSNPNDPINLIYFYASLLLFTVIILLVSKFWKKQLVQALILISTGSMTFYVFYPLLSVAISESGALGLSLAAAVVLVVMLVKYPEWYVLDVCGVVVGSGATAMMGISLSIFLVIVLLVGLAIYDAIAVYKTKHMIDLADTVLDLKLPVLLVIPKLRKYSLLKQNIGLKEKLKEEEERDAFFIGLGDIIMPGILVASTFYNLGGFGLTVALSVMLGTLFGFVILMKSVSSGKPQAGLPYLCTGAILGYLVSSYLLFGTPAGLTSPL